MDKYSKKEEGGKHEAKPKFTVGEQQEKLAYEQLEQVAGNLNLQCRQLQTRINMLQQALDNFNQIEVLLSIIGKGENFSSDFVVRCCNRVEKLVSDGLDASEQFEKEQREAQMKAAKEDTQD